VEGEPAPDSNSFALSARYHEWFSNSNRRSLRRPLSFGFRSASSGGSPTSAPDPEQLPGGPVLLREPARGGRGTGWSAGSPSLNQRREPDWRALRTIARIGSPASRWARMASQNRTCSGLKRQELPLAALVDDDQRVLARSGKSQRRSSRLRASVSVSSYVALIHRRYWAGLGGTLDASSGASCAS
jgi:hypothetical protein